MRSNEVKVGAAVILGIALVVAGTIWLKGAALGRGQVEISARFDEVGQLLEGNSVKLRGVPIGRVLSIALDTTGRGVLVTMRIDEDASRRLPEDPAALLSPESMFGDWQAEIVPRADFPTYDFAEAPDPAILPGYSLPDISRLTAVADEIAENMATLSSRVETAFTEETALKLRRAVDNIVDASDKISRVMTSQEGPIEKMSEDLQEIAGTMRDASRTMSGVLDQVERAVSEDALVQIVADVQATSSRTAALADTLLAMGRDMRGAAATADSTLRTVGSIASAIERGEGSLGMLMTDSTLFVSLRESNLELQALLRDIRENPKKYINVRVF